MSAALSRDSAAVRSDGKLVRWGMLPALTIGVAEVRAQAPVLLQAPTGEGVVELAMLGDNVLMTSFPFSGPSWRVDLFDPTTGDILVTFPRAVARATIAQVIGRVVTMRRRSRKARSRRQ
jgi:hypothetical protein